MTRHLLIPRLDTDAAVARLAYIGAELRGGTLAHQLVVESRELATPNTTGGSPAEAADLHRWRRDVTKALEGARTGSASDNATHSMRLASHSRSL